MPGDKRVPLPKRAPSPWLPVGSALMLLVLLAIVIPSVALALQLWVVCVLGAILAALSLQTHRAGQSNRPIAADPDVPAAQSAPAASAPPPAPAAVSVPQSEPGAVSDSPSAPAPPDGVVSEAQADGPGAGWAVLTEAEAADLLRVDVDSIVTAIESGELPGNRIGANWRIRTESLLAWLDGIYESPRTAARTARVIQPPGAAGEGR